MFALTITFVVLIALLVPRTNVTLYDDGSPALTIAQETVLPSPRFVVATPNGARLAHVQRVMLSRLGRHRWVIEQEGRYVGEARESSLHRALVRKLLGKFNRRFESDFTLTFGGIDAGRITRRRDASGRADLLELTSDAIDRRVAVAVATLILGREP